MGERSGTSLNTYNTWHACDTNMKKKENVIDSLTKEQVAVFDKMSNNIRNILWLNNKIKS